MMSCSLPLAGPTRTVGVPWTFAFVASESTWLAIAFACELLTSDHHRCRLSPVTLAAIIAISRLVSQPVFSVRWLS